MAARKKSDTVTLTFRLREDLRRRLEKEAKARRVSLNSELIRRVEESFTHEESMLARSHVMGLQAAIRSLAQHLDRVAIDDRHSREDPSERLSREQRRTETARRSVDEITALEAEAERTQNDSLIGFFRAQRAERERWLRDQEKWLAVAEGRVLDEPMTSVSQEDFEKGLKELADFTVKGFEAVKQKTEKPEGSKS